METFASLIAYARKTRDEAFGIDNATAIALGKPAHELSRKSDVTPVSMIARRIAAQRKADRKLIEKSDAAADRKARIARYTWQAEQGLPLLYDDPDTAKHGKRELKMLRKLATKLLS